VESFINKSKPHPSKQDLNNTIERDIGNLFENRNAILIRGNNEEA
jgi:hypothetical protein